MDAKQKRWYRTHRRRVKLTAYYYGKLLYLKHREEIEEIITRKAPHANTDEIEQFCMDFYKKLWSMMVAAMQRGVEIQWGMNRGTGYRQKYYLYFRINFKTKLWQKKLKQYKQEIKAWKSVR